MSAYDIRWQQRFASYRKATDLLFKAADIAEPNEFERMGLIQAYEVSIELAWKLMFDYLKDLGFTEKSPKSVIKRAFEQDIIKDGEVWVKALNHRNKTVHTYNEAQIIEIETAIRDDYLHLFAELITYFDSNMRES